jgi:shikimate kinase
MVLDEVKNNIRCVVGTGGGIVLKNTNWAKLQTGLVVYLKVR